MQKGDKSGPKDETVHSVRLVAKVLDKNDPQRQGLNFFRVVINPDDFGQSVENCFYISFLIKDGRAGVEVADDGEVIIREYHPYHLFLFRGLSPLPLPRLTMVDRRYGPVRP
jgi:hypothetical protein